MVFPYPACPGAQPPPVAVRASLDLQARFGYSFRMPILRARKSVVRGGALLHALLAWALLGQAAYAESLRCAGGITEVGDSRISVVFKCGEPLLKDSFCAPVYSALTLRPVPEPFAGALVPCLVVDEWLYDRGPGNLVAKVRFQSGTVQSITYARVPD